MTEEEKYIIKSTKFIYDENYMYMDMETVDEDSVFTMNMNMMDMMEVNMDGTFKYEERITDPLVKPDENSFTVSLTEILF